MTTPSIYIKGIEQLERQTNSVLKAVTSQKTELLQRNADIVKNAIWMKAPLGKNGLIKKSPYAKALPETTTLPTVAFAGIRPKTAPHGHLVEFGHGGPHPAPAHPFVQPAWDATREYVLQNIKDGLKSTIEGSI